MNVSSTTIQHEGRMRARPWNVWFCLLVLAYWLVHFCGRVLEAMATLASGVVHALASGTSGDTTLGLVMLLAVPVLIVTGIVAWALALYALYRGKPWGLLVSFGALTTGFYSALGALLVADGVGVQTPLLIALLAIVGCGGLLLAPSVREFCELSAWPTKRIVLIGWLIGTAASLAYFGAVYSVNFSALLLKPDAS